MIGQLHYRCINYTRQLQHINRCLSCAKFQMCPGRCFQVHSSTLLLQLWSHRNVSVHKDNRGNWKLQLKIIYISDFQLQHLKWQHQANLCPFKCIINELGSSKNIPSMNIEWLSYRSFGGTDKIVYRIKENEDSRYTEPKFMWISLLYVPYFTWILDNIKFIFISDQYGKNEQQNFRYSNLPASWL